MKKFIFVIILFCLSLYLYVSNSMILNNNGLEQFYLTQSQYSLLEKAALEKGDINASERIMLYCIFYKHETNRCYDFFEKIARDSKIDNSPLVLMSRILMASLYHKGIKGYKEKNIDIEKYYQKIAVDYAVNHCNNRCLNDKVISNILEGRSPGGSIYFRNALSLDTPCSIVNRYYRENISNINSDDEEKFEIYLNSYCRP